MRTSKSKDNYYFNDQLKNQNAQLLNWLSKTTVTDKYSTISQFFQKTNDSINEMQEIKAIKQELNKIYPKEDTSFFHLFNQSEEHSNTYDKRIPMRANFSLTKNKSSLFRRHYCTQQKELNKKKIQIQRQYLQSSSKHLKMSRTNQKLSSSRANNKEYKIIKKQFTIKNNHTARSQKIILTNQDLDKLAPGNDLNDAIIEAYFKILQSYLFQPSNSFKFHFFSTFFMQKLLGDLIKEEVLIQMDEVTLMQTMKTMVRDRYKNVRRWTKNIDIFSKQILIFPINAFNHWFCVFVINPFLLIEPTTTNKCQIVYCDSMFECRDFIVDSIRRYLQLQLQDKRQRQMMMNKQNVPSYQLLLPRQTNTHDCGLYMMNYVEELILNKENQFNNLKQTANRNKLHLFPQKSLLSLRFRLNKLLTQITSTVQQYQQQQYIAKFFNQKFMIISQYNQDYDRIVQKQFMKYKLMFIPSMCSPLPIQQREFICLLRFYYDSQINYYESDQNL